jgi:N,N-dimethylformamidase
MVADDDLEAFASGDDLRALYDLVIFPGHSEYMTAHAYDVVERYRDLGGRLVFLSANNFFWKVEKQGSTMRRIKLWRSDGRPEARLAGVQYRANDDGTRQGPFTVVAAEAAPWLFDKTGLENGSTFGETLGGYGIEIDTTTPDSPPGTTVLARIVDLFGPGLSAEMTYYENEAGARVFAAGVLDFGGSATFWPVTRMLDNLWNHMLADVAPPPAPPAAT